jgi:hypothetical protein
MLRPALHAGERLPPSVGDRQPQHAERPAACLHDFRPRGGESGAHDPGKQPDREPVRSKCPLCAPVRTAGQDVERAELVGAQATISWVHRYWTPVRVSRGGCSCQCGRASAPMIPQFVHTIRGPNDGTGTSSDHGSALRIVLWWHTQQHTSSDRTPLARMLPSVIGSNGSLKRLAAIRQL